MTALVTGGAGFIGSNLVDELVSQGHTVICIDDESAESNSEFYYNDKAVNMNFSIRDFVLLNNVCKKYKPEWIFHLAAESRIQPTIERPQDACQTNFVGTCNVLEAARNCGARVMYSSTSSAYGMNEPPQCELMERDCLNPYSVTKVAAEDLCKMYYTLFGVETIIFRYFNVYGNRQPVKGQYAPVIGIFLRQRAADEPMTIVGDGKRRRDYLNVKDAVNANIKAAQCTNESALGQVFNIGTGMNYSILDLTQMIGGPVKHIEDRPGEAKITLANINKAKRILGWKPQVTLESYIDEVRL